MNNPLNEVKSFSSTDHAISVTEVGDNAKVRFPASATGSNPREVGGKNTTQARLCLLFPCSVSAIPCSTCVLFPVLHPAPVWWSQVDFITTFAGPTGNQECAGKEPTSGTFSMVTDIVQTTTTETNPDNSTYTVRGGTAKFNLFTEDYVSCSLSQTIPTNGCVSLPNNRHDTVTSEFRTRWHFLGNFILNCLLIRTVAPSF